ncbi:hypothetical protein ASPCADRAFT_204843 [Aspergillus carbonarius ITEM 5010]|uniref:Uncharacterized protein n=1 Tax=Aspergillus carbonarius (strain ITEM 5010) TaxID=602072 RepID=A0A1R3RXJ9_ASPC5|nr:hypothetical protein ASPCADRAFT_204843 [Aspergillus carbonarius ITEM 5010]
MAYPNHLYRHELPPDVSSYIEMPTDIENYVKSRYGIDVHAEVTLRRQRWVVWASIRLDRDELENMVLELTSQARAQQAGE